MAHDEPIGLHGITEAIDDVIEQLNAQGHLGAQDDEKRRTLIDVLGHVKGIVMSQCPSSAGGTGFIMGWP